MDSLRAVVTSKVAGYARQGLNSESCMTQNAEGTVFTVVVVSQQEGQHLTFVSLLVRLLDNIVVVERDQNSDPIVDALVQAGVPRSQIVLAYAGEPVPEAA